MAARKPPRIPRERHCDIDGSGHSVPSGPRAMAPASAIGHDGRESWLRNERFQVTYNNTRSIWRHHKRERLRAILKDPGLIRIEVKPSYELLVIFLEGVKMPYRFYMTSGYLDDCSLGRNVWAMRTLKLPDDYLSED